MFQVNDFTSLKETAMSPPTMVRNLPWKIMIMPRNSNDNSNGGRKSMGFFLQASVAVGTLEVHPFFADSFSLVFSAMVNQRRALGLARRALS